MRCWMATVSSEMDSPACSEQIVQPRLCRVAVRRGFGLGAEVGREVGRRHVYFVKRRARERADRADIADAGFDDLRRRGELQSLSGLCRDLCFPRLTQAMA